MEQVHPGVYEIRSITYTENRVVMMTTSSSIIIMIMPPAAPIITSDYKVAIMAALGFRYYLIPRAPFTSMD